MISAATTTKTLGIVGTMVWDRIVPVGRSRPESEGWGGIAYGVAGAAAAVAEGWSVRPLVRLGADLAESAADLLGQMPRVDTSGLVVVAEPNNRVELRYHSAEERTERLTGGVSDWDPDHLLRAADGCDAVLVNFVSGYEMSLESARRFRSGFGGPLYADLHSLLLGMTDDGIRVPRSLPEWREWCDCFDAVQMNDREFDLLGSGDDRPAGLEGLLIAGVRVAAMTRGGAGVRVAWLEDEDQAHAWTPGRGDEAAAGAAAGGRVESAEVTLRAPRRGDPTGCGDVWGGAMFARLLAGDPVCEAAALANRLAALSVDRHGLDGLAEALASVVAGGSDRGVDDEGMNDEEERP